MGIKTEILKSAAAVLFAVTLAASCNQDEYYTSYHQRADNGHSAGSRNATTSLFVATDRHEAGSGNNLADMVSIVAGAPDVVRPDVVLLGGDYVGGRGDMTPSFSTADLKQEIYYTLPSRSTEIMMTYGSHDNNCTDGYGAFYSGPRRHRGYYTYGIAYIQMVYADDSTAYAAIQYHKDDTTGVAPPPMKPNRGYDGIDAEDPYGVSAESATASFSKWVNSLADRDPIVVMSHVPIHANRNDNPGGIKWLEALNAASERHDVFLFFGHNHTLEERGDSLDRYCYLLTRGDSLTVQGDSLQGRQRRGLQFTYVNAGYLKLGKSTLVTFTDSDGNGRLEGVLLRRFSLSDDETSFGFTGRPNPYYIPLDRIYAK